MPDLSLTELLLGIVAATGVGGTGVAIARKRQPIPGTLDDHDLRIATLERADNVRAVIDRITVLERKMAEHESLLAQAIGKLTESSDRVWRAVESAGEKLDELSNAVVRLDVETTLERELRREAKTKSKGG